MQYTVFSLKITEQEANVKFQEILHLQKE